MRRREPLPARPGAFTLLEVLCVCAVLAILLATLAPAVGLQVSRARVSAEAASLRALAAAVQASFESTDLEGTNLAALPGSVPAGVDSTAFSSSLDPASTPATTNTFDWFAKVARQRGDVPVVGIAPTPALQPRVAQVLFNAQRNARVLLEGPLGESGQQRFLLLSLAAPAGELSLPPWPNPANPQDPANLALFADIWNTDWTNPAAVLPPTWTAALSAAQARAWVGGGAGRLWQLCVQRIVCPKFTVAINNTHPADSCFVYYNLNGTTAGSSAVVGANAGTQVLSGIYAGRTIQAYRGAAAPPSAQLFSQFVLRDNAEITLQD
ncbi:MAG TPA: type II secretion system protein [Opitutaceae bacterium]|nr:type II secretion system protein [Opitutaceae bacterium]